MISVKIVDRAIMTRSLGKLLIHVETNNYKLTLKIYRD